MNKPVPTLNRYVKTGWAIGELAPAMFVGITMIYFLFYLTEALRLSPVVAGVCLLVPRIWDVVTDPVMGAISDNTKTRFGRRRPYLFAGALLLGASFYSMFAVPHFESELHKAIYVTVMYAISSTAFTIYQVPYGAMIPEMSNDYKERVTLSGYKNVAARIGILLSVTVGPYIFNSGDNLAEGFETLGLVFGLAMTITGLVGFFTTKHAPRVERSGARLSILDQLKAVLKNRPFKTLFGVFLMQNIALGASATALVYYITVVMRADTTLVGQLFAVNAVTATVFTIIWVGIARRIGKARSYRAGLMFTATMTLPALFLPPSLYVLLFVILFLDGIGNAAHQLLPASMLPDTVEVDEMNTGLRREGAYFGAWTFCQKLGMAIGAFLVSVGLDLSGYVGGDASSGQSEQTVMGVRLVYALLPMFFWFAAIVALRKYDLGEKTFDAIKAKIRADATPRND